MQQNQHPISQTPTFPTPPSLVEAYRCVLDWDVFVFLLIWYTPSAGGRSGKVFRRNWLLDEAEEFFLEISDIAPCLIGQLRFKKPISTSLSFWMLK